MCCQPGRLETLLGLLPVSSRHNRRRKEKSWLLLSHRITFFFPLYLFLFSSSWYLEVTEESPHLTDKKSHDRGLSLLLKLHLLLCFSVPKVRAMAKRAVLASAHHATLPDQSVVAFLIHWFILHEWFFLADPYRSSGDVSGWDGLVCAFCNRPGMSESIWVPHRKGISQTTPPPNKEFESHYETPNNRWIPKQSRDLKCWAILPLNKFLTWKRSQGKLKRSKASEMRAFSVSSLSHKWRCLSWRSGCKDSKSREFNQNALLTWFLSHLLELYIRNRTSSP